jgi:hypothetical protein
MGIGIDFLHDLAVIKRAGLLDDCSAVAEIGRQQFSHDVFGSSQLHQLCTLYSIPVPDIGAAATPDRFTEDAPYSRPLWQALGYRYVAIDIDGSPDSLPLDLNVDEVPAEHKGAYGLVANLGTTEHVANQINAFKVVHDVTAVGGVMMHHVPTQGYMMHGLVNYNLKFFWMLARSNLYQFVDADLQCSPIQRPLSSDLSDFISKFRPCRDFTVPNGFLYAALRKTSDQPFMPPLDIPTGSLPPNETIKRRYWPVYSQWMSD